MEKYTIDIDKVLDEFEETEALKNYCDKNSNETSKLCQPSVDVSFLDGKGVHESVSVLSHATTVNADQNPQISLPAKKDSFQCSDIDFQNELSPTISNEHCTAVTHSDVFSKHLKYNIFYKPSESISDCSDELNGCSQIVDTSSQELDSFYNFCVNNTDEVLCISVQEQGVSELCDESQVSLPTISDLAKKNLSESVSMELENKPSLVSEELANTSNETQEFNNESSEKGELNADCYLSQKDAADFTGESQEVTYNTDYVMDDIKENVKDVSVSVNHSRGTSANDVSCIIESQHFEIKSDLTCKQSIENCNIQPNLNSTLENMSDTPKINYVNDVRSLHFQELNTCNIQDNDSGVSSIEDISGNSSVEAVHSEPSSSDTNGNICTETHLLSTVEITEKKHSENVMPETPLCLLQNEIPVIELSQHQDVNNACLIDSALIGTGTRNIDPAFKSTDISPTVGQTDFSEINSLKENDCQLNCLNSSKILLLGDSELCEGLDKSNYENKISMSDSKNLMQEYEANTEDFSSQNLCCDIKIVHEEIDESFAPKEPFLTCNEISENMECSNQDDITEFDNSHPRLQRPTTLHLPSVQNTVSDVPAKSSPMLVSQNKDLTEVQVLPEILKEPDSTVSFSQQSQIGNLKPYWIPDAEAAACMQCGMKFTVLKRRHHCRGCGKVLCSRCCNQRAYLAYLNKEDRICQPCSEILSKSLQSDHTPLSFDSQSSSSCGSSPNFSPLPQNQDSGYGDKNLWRPHPNNPDDYCSTIPPLQQIQSVAEMPPPTVMVPIGVLKRAGNNMKKEPKQVIFSDGIRPGGDLTDTTEPCDNVPAYRRMGRKRVDKIISEDSKHVPMFSSYNFFSKSKTRVLMSDDEGPLPPVILPTGTKNSELQWDEIYEKLRDDQQKPVSFALTKNVHLLVKIVKLDCCFGNECWCFTSDGLCIVGQDEVMVILEKLPDERNVPRDILKLFTHVYDSASKGSTFNDLGHIIFSEPILGCGDHRGFLFVRPTFQCLSKLIVPDTPYLIAIIIHKWEVPWAKVFPLRLMLRLGAECRYYPCSLVSVRNRKPVYFEIGQTILSVLADLRNYQFTIPVIPGLVVHMEEKKTYVNIPRNRYEKVIKVLNSNNVEHVLALGSNFSTEADSHLVCMQKEEGEYQTQAINIENTTRKVTGASFIVFSGALKSTSGLSAKFSIVEDGLLIQIPQETMVALHMALRDMKNLTIECGQVNASAPEETVILQWTREDKQFNIGVKSPIDGKHFDGIPNLRIHTSTDYASENYLIRWTEVFFLDMNENGVALHNELVDPCRLAESVAQSCCMALTPFLDQLAESELTKIGLRITLDSQRDRVEYDIGAHSKALPASYMTALDSGLIPVLLRLSSSTQKEKLSFELIFHILIK